MDKTGPTYIQGVGGVDDIIVLSKISHQDLSIEGSNIWEDMSIFSPPHKNLRKSSVSSISKEVFEPTKGLQSLQI